ncbi:uncharacterized protein KY384_006412 [Bacidia gigantensis]|uniref:uncharacterized protein n=1 Tax=Bacidia gigantensis TaxID=2732470 RepID=UPI001D05B78A|nr:uncharacterized protein KY384_006412 [Bacidia gigantensis]KAG8528725.1 hypothetical protein KY384_006412 [Bacidia gigantensis]
MAPPANQPSDHQGGYSTELKKALAERHTNMIAFSTIVGIGFFLQAGRIIFLAGPGLAWIAYLLMGAAIWFAYIVVLAAEVTAIANLFKFQFDPKYLQQVGYPSGYSVDWSSTANISPAVFVVLWLLFILGVNLLRVRIYGEIEYIIGCIKMIFIVGLIMFNIVNNARNHTYFKYYQQPWGFDSKNFTSSSGHTYEGGSAHFAAMWTAMTVTIFSLIGFEAVSITAPESKDLETEENIKLATRKTSLRIILLYTLGIFVVGLNIPYDDPQIVNNDVNSFANGAHSAFIVAAVRDGVIGFPTFFNAFFIFSATSAGMNSLYLSSRLLHALANVSGVWPKWPITQSLRRRLERTSESGVPRAAVLTSWFLGWLGLLAVKAEAAQVLGRMATNATVSMLITYTVICGSFLKFFRSIRRAAQGLEPPILNTGQDRAAYNREDKARYPYKSHWQFMRAWYGMIACGAMAFFNGWRTVQPIAGKDFVASYISIFIFLLLAAAYHVKIDNSWNPLNWSIAASEDLSNPEKALQPNPLYRRGRLHRKDRDSVVTYRNLEKRTDLATTLRDAIGQYTLQTASGVENPFATNSIDGFIRLVNLIKIALHLQKTYLQSRYPSPNIRQYLLEPALVSELLNFLLTVKDNCLRTLGYPHPLTDHLLRLIGAALLSGLRLLTLFKKKLPIIEDYDWVSEANFLKSRLRNAFTAAAHGGFEASAFGTMPGQHS